MNILVFHDAGEECDDQIALWKLDTYLSGAKIFAVVCGKTREIQEQRLAKWKELFSKIDTKRNLFVNVLLCDANFPDVFKFDAVLQIAPLFGFDSENIKTDLYVLMGSVDNSVNCPKDSVDLFRRFQGQSIVVESAEAAKVRPTKDFLKSVPQVLVDEMVSVGFRLALCRCDPNEVYAEGLINSNVGRGANFTTIFNMYNAVCGKIEIEFEFNECTEIEWYIESLKVKKFPEITKNLMYTMYKALDTIFGFEVPVITAPGWSKFLESGQGIKAFAKFKEVAMEHPEILNPMYDYHAATILLDNFDVSGNRVFDGVGSYITYSN